MVHYLKDGEDFGPSHFRDAGIGFTGSARGAIPNNNRAEAQSMPSGQRTKPMDPEITSGRGDGYAVEQREPMRKGGPVRLPNGPIKNIGHDFPEEAYSAKKVSIDKMKHSRGAAYADGGEAKPKYDRQGNQIGRYWDEDYPNGESQRVGDKGPTGEGENYHRGGRIRRAVGGVIPGEAPAPIDQPMTRPQTPAPMGGNPLARASVTMPASDMSQLAAGAVKLGARTALNAAAMRGKAALQPRMGPAGNAPAATPPPPAPNTIPAGTRGMRGGGRVHRAIGGPMPGQMPQQVPQQMPQGAMTGGVPMQRPMPTAGAVPGVMPAMKGGGHLSAKQRHALPKSDFALPGGRYPVNDENHARNALARVSQFGSTAEKAAVRSKVHSKYPDIGKGRH